MPSGLAANRDLRRSAARTSRLAARGSRRRPDPQPDTTAGAPADSMDRRVDRTSEALRLFGSARRVAQIIDPAPEDEGKSRLYRYNVTHWLGVRFGMPQQPRRPGPPRMPV